ncbi:uncharacterized protein LACBIDRAFT_296000 [Laccaria bicolor S238N-H82]|uniref:Predicted protein n=1 Tax=Laccaria bicolor (strain S238N-H82 / ATCC MYA-4686) TaxID=486041 RepID=B0E1M5_LACBS|nr:uncharacterized protein LACBIDRAFT_296000 [Laccaria bicolor S238N-H82]EDQ99292.1 predicted protein [Laccaria bicolor S238N-H82]|eukprot:XP_001890102.1 predicted protein [Laccaria bicolor S238N-H82]
MDSECLRQLPYETTAGVELGSGAMSAVCLCCVPGVEQARAFWMRILVGFQTLVSLYRKPSIKTEEFEVEGCHGTNLQVEILPKSLVPFSRLRVNASLPNQFFFSYVTAEIYVRSVPHFGDWSEPVDSGTANGSKFRWTCSNSIYWTYVNKTEIVSLP